MLPPHDTTSPGSRPAITRADPPGGGHVWVNGIAAGFCLYMFLSAINVMGKGLKGVGEASDVLRNLLAHAGNPFVALMGSVLITAVVQSSSFTTALIITLVAAGQLEVETAVYAVMGANIGTSVTNIIVAFGNVRIRKQFRRAFTAALVHDVFNWLTVAMLFPLEWITSAMSKDGLGVLTRFATWGAAALGLEEMEKPNSPIKVITRPVVDLMKWLTDRIDAPDAVQDGALAGVGLIMLIIALMFMVKNLKGALLRRIEGLFRRVFFRNDFTAYVVGAISTILVQSSSVTTSLIVPFAGAGAVKLKRVFPFTLGANLGTTVTGVIAATANPVAAAVAVAIAHVTFNLIGTAIWYPLRRVPLGIARWYGRLASRSRRYAVLFLVVVFVVFPLVGLIVTDLILRLTAGS